MQFKKMAALTGTALLAGLTIATPVLAATITTVGDISKMVTVTGQDVSYPTFVVGANAKTEDVAGAINVAVNLASNAKTQTAVTVPGLSQETVTGGVKIRTPGTEFTPYASVGDIKGIITSADTTMLAKGTYSTTSGGSYEYKQYLYLGGESGDTDYSATTMQVVYETPTTEGAPRTALKLTGNKIGYKYKMTFSTPVSLTAATSVSTMQSLLQGTSLSILGKDFVISDCTWNAAATPFTDFTLIGGKNVVTVKSGEDKTVTNNAKDYVVHIDGVASETSGTTTVLTAIGSINGESFTLRGGQTSTLSDGTIIAAVKVIQGKTGEADYAKIAVGADKIKVTAAGTVTKGTQTEATLTAAITQSTNSWSGFTIIYKPSIDTWLKEGEALSDKFASTFDLKFNSISPSFTDTVNRQTISFTPSGYNMMLKMKNAVGNDINAYTVYTADGTTYNWASTTGLSGTYTDNTIRDIVFDEGSNISAIDADYFVISKSGFSHVMQFTSFTPSTSELTFTDEVGNTITSSNTSSYAGSVIVDGNSFAYKVFNSTDENRKVLNMDLNGDGYIAGILAATYQIGAYVGTTTGREYSYLVPKLVTSGQGGLYFYKGRAAANITTTGSYPGIGIGGVNISASGSTVSVAQYDKDTTVGDILTAETSTITAPANGTYAYQNYTLNSMDYVVRVGGNQTADHAAGAGVYNYTVALNYTNSLTEGTVQRGFVLVQEALQGTTTHNWIFVPVLYDATYKIYVGTTIYTDDANKATTNWDKTIQGTATEYRGMTTFGSLVTHTTANLGGLATISYPDSYTYANVYVLSPEGVITVGAADSSVMADKVLPIVTDVVKMDSEYGAKDAVTNDVVIVGGPCINKLAAWMLGKEYPACGATSGVPEGKAIVKVVKDAFVTGKSAFLIAGWEAANTDFACQVVQAGKLVGNTKDSVTVSGTNVLQPTIE